MYKLKPDTIRKKKKTSNYPSRPLWDTGLMSRCIASWKLKEGTWVAGIKPVLSRDLLGIIHQYEGASRKRVRRMFLGITTRDARELRSDAYRWYRNVIQKAYLKKVKMSWGNFGGSFGGSSDYM